MTIRLRNLSATPAYKPGKAAPTDAPDAHTVFKLSSNENPYPPLPSVVRALEEQLDSVNRYPETAASALTRLLCERFDVEPENVVFGSGSVEIISQLMRATAGAGDEIVFAWRSFEAYPMLAVAAGATPVAVPLTPTHEHDFAAMLAAITPRTRLILVCNPNNPTGTTISADALEDFLAKVPAEIVVVVDEAYLQFNRRPDTAIGVDAMRRHDNVVVAHTFSKAYGLAGLRVGYALAPETVATALRQVALPFGVTSLAQAAAVASLHAETELDIRVDELVAERDRVGAALAEQGWELPASGGNFLWFPLGDDTTTAADVFEEHGLLVRPFAGDGLRVTIAEREANDRIIAAGAALRSSLLQQTAVAELELS
ncbi:histidinol-phosphate transaminase [Leifsonia poae]|uniref:histidinol-phosphate transaminase n=1 Tax=Leifsonia poae TaxID=110933 RepID=UPI001CC08F88|nr:histidinol-phosphate transaminase [Leifsonia poae]